MHDKLVKQLRNSEHCAECRYNEDCNEFDSCLMELLAADAIEDMNKRIARQEKELQEKYKYIENEEYLFGKDWQVEYDLECKQDLMEMGIRAANEIMSSIHQKDKSGEMLFHFVNSLYKTSRLTAYRITNEHRFVVLKEDEYEKLKDNS